MTIRLVKSDELPRTPVRVVETDNGEVHITYNKFAFLRLRTRADRVPVLEVHSLEDGLLFEADFTRISVQMHPEGDVNGL